MKPVMNSHFIFARFSCCSGGLRNFGHSSLTQHSPSCEIRSSLLEIKKKDSCICVQFYILYILMHTYVYTFGNFMKTFVNIHICDDFKFIMRKLTFKTVWLVPCIFVCKVWIFIFKHFHSNMEPWLWRWYA